MLLKDFIPNVDRRYGGIFFSGISFDSTKVKKNNNFFDIKGNKLDALIGSDYDENFKYNSSYDQVFLNYGIKPLDELYYSLVPFSKNKGEVDYNKFINGDEQDIIKNDNNKFNLFRIGDAVSSRNIHAAIYDALRLVINL